MSIIKIPFIEINQPIGTFYVGKINYIDLIDMCSKDLNEISENKYDILQRKLDITRIPSLKIYMNYSKATFPNGIILYANNSFIKSDNYLEVEKEKDAFFIIDGQHRIEALKYYKGNKPFEICVIIFTGLSKDERTDIFATVNSEQHKVNPTVKLNLKGNDSVDTPEKVVRKIAILFNDSKESPFYNRINFTDEYNKRDTLKISLAAFMKPIVSNIYNMEKSFLIKDYLYRNNNNRLTLTDAKISFDNKILWNFYVRGEEDIIYLMLLNFFTAVSDILSTDWNDKQSLLAKTSGYNALIMLFVDVFKNSLNDMSYDYLLKTLLPLESMRGHFYLDEIGVGNSASLRLYNKFKKILYSSSEDEKINLFDFIEE